MQSYRSSQHAPGRHYIPTMHSRSQQVPARMERPSRKVLPPEIEVVNELVRTNKTPPSKPPKPTDKSKKRKSAGKNGTKKLKQLARNPLAAPFPLLQLPRVELWCRNPECTYNNKIHLPESHSHDPHHSQHYGSRVHQPDPRYSQPSKLSSVTSISTPLASDSNTTDTTLTIKSSSSGSNSQNDHRKMSKYAGVHEFYPGGASGRVPPPPKQVSALNTIIPRTAARNGHRNSAGSNPATSSSSSCAGCRGPPPQHRLDDENSIDDGKMDHSYSTFWHLNNSFPNLQSTLKRDASVHSYGGFTLNGHPGHNAAKKKSWQRFCSSHKIALVVSTFSLLVTVGLVITLLLMKKKGMMEAM